MKSLFTFFILLTATIAFAQKQVTTFYKNYGRQVSLRDSADYMRTISAPDSGSKLYNVNDYYMSGQSKLSGKSRSPEYAYFEGECQEFYITGKRKTVSMYKTNALVGQQQLFYNNGIVAETRLYGDTVIRDPYALPERQYLIIALNDSTGTALITNGNGHYKKQTSATDKLIEEGDVKAGLREGLWKGRDDGAKITFQEYYSGGKLIKGTSVTSGADSVQYSGYRYRLPQFKGGIKNFYQFLARSVRYPQRAVQKSIQGRVDVGFVVEKDGSLVDIASSSKVDEELVAEAIRVMKKSPAWEPGIRFGRPVRVFFTSPIIFTLGR